MPDAQRVVHGTGVGDIGVGVTVALRKPDSSTVDRFGLCIQVKLCLNAGISTCSLSPLTELRDLERFTLLVGEARTLGVLEVAVGGHVELAVARIGQLLILGELKEAVPGNGQVEAATGGFEAAGTEILKLARDARAEALAIGEDIRELHRGALEAHGLRVGDVIADGVQLRGGRVDPAQ